LQVHIDRAFRLGEPPLLISLGDGPAGQTRNGYENVLLRSHCHKHVATPSWGGRATAPTIEGFLRVFQAGNVDRLLDQHHGRTGVRLAIPALNDAIKQLVERSLARGPDL
jgi:hypothetical protein